MVICNIVVDGSQDMEPLRKHIKCPAINVIDDITHIHTEVPTLFYGYKNAVKHCGEFDRGNRRINSSYLWTYSKEEVDFECWVDEFVETSTKLWFNFIDNGIDVVFDEFDTKEFVSHLNPFPLIHEGNFEIYIADWRDGNINIHSIKKDTLEYVGIEPKKFLEEMYSLLDYAFLTIEAKRFNLLSKRYPLFLDDLLFANSNEWVGIPEITKHFSNVDIDRKKVIIYYLKRSEYLRPKFHLYR